MRALFVSSLVLVLAIAGFGQEAAGPVNRIIGTIQSVKGDNVVIKKNDGQSVETTLGPSVRITETRKGTLADIKEGTFVGSAAMKGSDGKMRAEEVHIFAEEMRGAGEGFRPWGKDPNRTMTNGAISKVEKSGAISKVAGNAQGQEVTIKYKDGEQHILVTPLTPITVIAITDVSALKPGTMVALTGVSRDDEFTIRNIQVNPNLTPQ